MSTRRDAVEGRRGTTAQASLGPAKAARASSPQVLGRRDGFEGRLARARARLVEALAREYDTPEWRREVVAAIHSFERAWDEWRRRERK